MRLQNQPAQARLKRPIELEPSSPIVTPSPRTSGNSVPAVSCDPFTLEECDEKESAYAKKWVDVKEKDAAKFDKEQARLDKMSNENKLFASGGGYCLSCCLIVCVLIGWP